MSDCCMVAKESRNLQTSSLYSMVGNGASKLPLATSLAELAKALRGVAI